MSELTRKKIFPSIILAVDDWTRCFPMSLNLEIMCAAVRLVERAAAIST